MTGRSPQIAIVGPCASGKTTLAQGLRSRGYDARQIVQEHSFVPEMWQVITRPDVLIFVDASYATCTQRKALNWEPHEHHEQLERLAHARGNCQIYVQTDRLDAAQVLAAVLEQLRAMGYPPPRRPAA